MRLLNAKSQKLEYFQSSETPPYVILSHTWGEEEVSFQDISGSETLSHLKGYQKISRCCQQAVTDGYEYVWIDTCCIDKTSSAELSEAINSMFQWYAEADMCYAYLSDVKASADLIVKDSELAKSRWFTRGWTLQELIAPSNVIFYESKWLEIGTKISLRNTLTKITSISSQILDGGSCDSCSVACRMSWASKRVTTRLEDEAYCLMGIFGVNMPLLYGEGEKAFLRLQEEIMKRSDDHSLFAWTAENMQLYGLLAGSPRDFSESGNIERLKDEPMSLPYSITNKGVQITLQLVKSSSVPLVSTKHATKKVSAFECRKIGKYFTPIPAIIGLNMIVALLNCQMSDTPGQPIAIVLVETENRKDYLRTHLHFHLISPLHFSESGKAKVETIFIKAQYTHSYSLTTARRSNSSSHDWCKIRTPPPLAYDFFILEMYPVHVWAYRESVLHLALNPRESIGRPAVLLFESSGYRFAVLLQGKNRRFYADIVSCRGGEVARDVSTRFQKELEPRDCVSQRLSQEKVVWVSIRNCPGGHVAVISIHSEESPTELKLDKMSLSDKSTDLNRT